MKERKKEQGPAVLTEPKREGEIKWLCVGMWSTLSIEAWGIYLNHDLSCM